MQKALLSAAGATLIGVLTMMPSIASADHRYHRDWDRGPGFSINIEPGYGYRHRDYDDRYAYYYGPSWRHRHHDRDHDDWDRD